MTETAQVRELIEQELEPDHVHGVTVTRRDGDTIYTVVTQSTTWDRVDDSVDYDVPVLDVRTVVVDLADNNVSASDNGIWVPQDGDAAEGLAQSLARATTELNNDNKTHTAPTLSSAVDDLDPDLLLDREIEVDDDDVGSQHVDKMKRHVGINPDRSWGYGAGPPTEVDDVVERLQDAGLDPEDHLSRLVWGKKEPMDRVTRPVEDLTGNYGIELQPRDHGLIAIDVDYPEEFPEEFDLPDTLEVSSPHGDDTQRHIVLKCDEKGEIAEEIGAWAVQAAPWGDLWIGDRYVVGPGSQLSEYGCDDGEHTRGEKGGCAACEDPDDGYYEVVDDSPIASVDAQTIIDLLEASPGYDLRNGRADPDPPEADDDQEDDDDVVKCDSCGTPHDPEDLKEVDIAGSTRRICRGGCDG